MSIFTLRYASLRALKAAAKNVYLTGFGYRRDGELFAFTWYRQAAPVAAMIVSAYRAHQERAPAPARATEGAKPASPAERPVKVTATSIMRDIMARISDKAAAVEEAVSGGMKRSTAVTLYGDISRGK